MNVGLSGGLLVANGRAGLFFGLIFPHGMLELTAVFVAAGIGLQLGWTLVDPGPRTRGQALAERGRTAASAALGLALVLAVSGVIEAFVTPSGLPTWARIGDRAAGRDRVPGLRAGAGAPRAAGRGHRRRRGRHQGRRRAHRRLRS